VRPATASPKATASADESLKFQIELLANISHELPPLIVAHHREIDPYQALDVPWDEWFKLNAHGRLHILTARHEHALVGYIANQVFSSLISKEKHALIDLYYLSPPYRFGYDAMRMFRENQRILDEAGVVRTYVTAVLSYRDGRVRSIFRRLGFEMTSEMWLRYADGVPGTA
jgi:hypothetical protein